MHQKSDLQLNTEELRVLVMNKVDDILENLNHSNREEVREKLISLKKLVWEYR